MKQKSENYLLIILVAFIVILFGVSMYMPCNSKKEPFTLPSPRPPNWFLPTNPYNTADWLVRMNMDRLSKPECLPYNRGDPGILNYNASSYRWFRF